LNLAAFWVIYNNAQRQVVVPIVRADGSAFQETLFFNAAKATVRGLEGEATFVPFRNLTLRGTAGYQDAYYNSFISPVPTGRDLTKAPLARTPKWQATIGGDYQVPVGSLGTLSFDANMAYESRNLFTLDVTSPASDAYLDGHTLINGSIGLALPDDRTQLRFIARNISNIRYKTGSQTVGKLYRYTFYGEPRYVGIELDFKFHRR